MPLRYIEDVLPLWELNKYAQKGGGIDSLNAMHPYFARRPLTASRAMTLAALVDAPKDSAQRKALEKLLVELSRDEWPDKPKLLQEAIELIRQTHGGRTPRVLDPFAGGGAMPLEAMRLGCDATALDLNPVAYLALIGSLVYPQKFGEGTGIRDQESGIGNQETGGNEQQQQTVIPGLESQIKNRKSKIQSPLVEEVHYWAGWVLTQAEAQIGECYPNDPDGAIPVAYLWAKTITCPHCGGEVPLVKRFWLQKGGRGQRSGGAGENGVAYLHKACLLWANDLQDDLSALVASRSGEMWPVAQAIVELLPKDTPESKALNSMLGTRTDLESRAQRWAERNPRRERAEARQLGLWGEGE